MSGVDLLAVLDRAAHFAQRDKAIDFQSIDEARAAVAELIEADKAYDTAMIAKFCDCTVSALEAFQAARDRRHAALARVGGES